MNIQLGPLHLGWREVLLAVVVMLGLYMLFVAWMMRGLRRQALPPAAVEPSVKTAAAAYAATAAAGEDSAGETPTESVGSLADEERASEHAHESRRQVEHTLSDEDALHLEVRRMRDELDALRAEFAALRAEVQHEAAQLKATQSISPLYSDAMQMATAGHPADMIAERCGISRAEAELVVALVRSQV